MEWAYVAIAALCSGLLGVAISNWYHQRNEIRRAKIAVLQQLLGNRHCLLPDVSDSELEHSFTEALNQVFVVFHDSSSVISALKAFHEVMISRAASDDLATEKLLDLFKAMCNHLSIDTAPLTDNFFLQPLSIQQRRP